jgi:hypothetical protein
MGEHGISYEEAFQLPEGEDPCGCFSKVFGFETAAGVAVVASGQPIPGSKPMRTPGSSVGTSVAGKAADKIFGQRKFSRKKFPKGVRTPSGGPTTGSKWRWTRTRYIARFVGRWVPYVGWGMLGVDFAQLSACLAKCEECSKGE